ncbi:MAG: Stf0 family sulfotransferase [Planctomycetota bacterium]
MTTLYLICCSMRTGSSLLHFMLRDAGIGDAHEYMHGNNPACDTYDEFAWHIRNGNSTSPHMIGWRMMWGQVWNQQRRKPDVWAHIEPETILDGVIHAVGADSVRYIHLTRRDRVRQAASILRAEAAKRWYCPTAEKPSYIHIPRNADRVKRLEWLVAEYPKYDERWDAYFAARNIEPLRLVYEDITVNSSSIRGAFWRMVDHIGATVPSGYEVTIPLRKQAGADVEDWIAWYELRRANV